MTVAREILGFHRDGESYWVAELSCGHNQHVRHRPPFEDRPWVLDDASRGARIGTELDCPLCERGECPDGLILFTTLGPYDEESAPPALLRTHSVAVSRWAMLTVDEASARLVFHDPSSEIELKAGDACAIRPLLADHLVPTGHVRFRIDVFGLPSRAIEEPAE